MRGTGSNDFSLTDAFVLERHTALLPPAKASAAHAGPLYRIALWTAVALLAVPTLGIARAAIDELIELARGKTPNFTASALANRQVEQRQVAEAEAALGSQAPAKWARPL